MTTESASGRVIAGLLFAMLASLTLGAAPPEGERGSDLTVGPAAICRDVRDRTPIDKGSTFPTTVGRLYCFTRINGATEPTQVTHVWFHGDREVHRMELSIGGPSWRTWTYKTIPPEWTGSWRVDIQDANDVIIYSLPFTVSDEPATGEPGEPQSPSGESED
jgi:hypothetical protein